MPTSVPGAFRNRCQAPISGFTLLELLVVLLIMGLFAGLVGALAQPDERALLRFEADRLAQLLDLAAEESRLTGKPIAWTADAAQIPLLALERSGRLVGGAETILCARAACAPDCRSRTCASKRCAPSAARGWSSLRMPRSPTTSRCRSARRSYVVAGSPLGKVTHPCRAVSRAARLHAGRGAGRARHRLDRADGGAARRRPGHQCCRRAAPAPVRGLGGREPARRASRPRRLAADRASRAARKARAASSSPGARK